MKLYKLFKESSSKKIRFHVEVDKNDKVTFNIEALTFTVFLIKI